MMTPFTVFDPRTGQIMSSGWCQDHMMAAQNREGCEILPITSDPHRQYYDLEARELRDLRLMQVNQYSNKFIDLPNPCTLTIDGVVWPRLIEDGTAELTFEFSGEYLLKFTSPTYLPFETVLKV
jgi:hypothetical protein